jgi:hypothetical protein
MTPSRLWLYRYPWSTLNAAGDGSVIGRTGTWSVPDDGGDEGGSREMEEHCAAITILCTGNRNTCSLAEDFEDAMARTCVGYVGWAGEPDMRIGIDMECGTCDLGIVVGKCDDDRAEIPASILCNETR